MRCLHESELHEDNCFITLTYDAAHVPVDGSLPRYQGGHFQKFMKRLRKRNGEKPIRFFSCGEYGEKLGRPHYHACLFGFDFKDKYLWSVKKNFPLYRSPELEATWGLGHALIGEVSFESAAYVARYIMKKVTGDDAAAHYDGRRPEYTTMSRRPGLARGWFDRFSGDCYPSDEVVVRGVRCRPPRYYDRLYEGIDAESFAVLKARRVERAAELVYDNDDFRLAVKEEVKKSRIKNLVRSMEAVDVD